MARNYDSKFAKKTIEVLLKNKRSPSQSMLKKESSSSLFSFSNSRNDFELNSGATSKSSFKLSPNYIFKGTLKSLGEKSHHSKVNSCDLEDIEALFRQKISIKPPDDESHYLSSSKTSSNLYKKNKISQFIEHMQSSSNTQKSFDASIEKNESLNQIEVSFQQGKYGSYKNLQNLYENEKTKLENLDNLYQKLHEEHESLKESFKVLSKKSEESLVSLKKIQEENHELKSSNKYLERQHDNTLERIFRLEKENKGLLDNLNKPSNRRSSLIDTIFKINPVNESSEIKELTFEIDKLKQTIKNLQVENQELKSKIDVENQELKPKIDVDSPTKVSSLFDKNDYFKKSADLIKSTLSATEDSSVIVSENNSLRVIIQSLRAQLDSNSQIQEINSLKERLEETKSENDSEKSFLQRKIQDLKKDNKEMFHKLKEKLVEWDHYRCHSLFKETATNLTQEDLARMTKEELIKYFNLLNKEYDEISKKMLSQADEMFENKSENKQLQLTKSKLLKELADYQKQESELIVLKDHVSYLLSVIQLMKEKITELDVYYSEIKKKEDIENEYNNKGFVIISELLKTEILTLSEKRSQMNWKDEKGKKILVDCVMNEFYNYVVTNY